MSTSPPAAPPTDVTFGGACPILRVHRVRESLAYYTDVLGFTVDWDYGVIASVSRGRCCLFLSEGDQGNSGSWAWIGVSDVDALHAEYRARGACIRQPPTNFTWACEMQVQDPDGNVLRMGSDRKPDQPFGPWLDMHGDLWERQPDERWVRVARGDARDA